MFQRLKRLLECFWCWDYQSVASDEFWSAGMIVSQGCSRRPDGYPSSGNLILATVASKLHEELGLRILAQEEVTQILTQDNVPVAFTVEGISSTGKSSLAWNTRTVAQAQAKFCRRYGVTKVIVVAVPLAMSRTLWVYQKLGLQTLPAPMPHTNSYYEKGLAHRSYQWSATAHLYELVSRLLFWWRGWM